MDIETFKAMIDTYGTHPKRWPSEHAATMKQLAEHSEQAQVLLEQSRYIDNTIDNWQIKTIMPDNFLTKLNQGIQPSLWQVLSPLSPKGLLMAMALVLGIYIGLGVDSEEITFETIAFNMEDEF